MASQIVRIEPLSSEKASFLKELMYLALFVPPGSDPLPLSILEQPQIERYYKHWGGKGDLGVLAWKHRELVGGAWCRLFDDKDPGYGFVNHETPELVVAVHSQYRNAGIGTRLLESLLHIASRKGFKRLSLSVQKLNPAIRLYKRMGFSTHWQDEDTCTLITNLLTYSHDSANPGTANRPDKL